MRTSELRERTDEDLRDELQGLQRELFNMRFQWQTEESSNPAQYARLRRSVAQIKTILHERELGLNTAIDQIQTPGAAAAEPAAEQTAP